MSGQYGIEFSSKEALLTPFICLNKKDRVSSAWKVRILLQGYCGLTTYKEGKPSKCSFCLVDNPYACMFRDSEQEMLFERLFSNG